MRVLRGAIVVLVVVLQVLGIAGGAAASGPDGSTGRVVPGTSGSDALASLTSSGLRLGSTGQLHDASLAVVQDAGSSILRRSSGVSADRWAVIAEDGGWVVVHAASIEERAALAALVDADDRLRAEPVPVAVAEGGPAEQVRWEGVAGYSVAHQRFGLDGAGVSVAVVDSGIRVDHEDLTGAVVQVGGVAVPDGRDDPLDHGTPIAGIIGARRNGVGIIGVAPNVSITSHRVFNGLQHGVHLDVIVEQFEAAVDSGARVVNLSLSAPDNYTPMEDAIRRAVDQGVVVVAAAGNRRGTVVDQARWPADIDVVISVGAHDASGAPAAVSMVRDTIDLYAPGEHLTAPSARAAVSYRAVEGTSYATPFVAGTAALLVQAHPEASVAQIRNWLLDGALVTSAGIRLLDIEGAIAASGYQPASLQPRALSDLRCDTAVAFTDLSGPLAHAAGCLAELGIVQGVSPDHFDASSTLTRGQLASLVVRAIDAGGLALPTGRNPRLTDIAGTTHEQAIVRLVGAGVLAGYPDATFRPNQSVTREQAARYLVGVHDTVTGQPLPLPLRRWFDDIDHSRHLEAIDQAATAGWIHGIDSTRFDPRSPLTRGDMLAFTARWYLTIAEFGVHTA